MLTRGTLVRTEVDGAPIAVEDLDVGMGIVDPLSGSRGRIERHYVRKADLRLLDGGQDVMAPVVIPQGALGHGRPERPLVVSARQKVGFLTPAYPGGPGLFSLEEAGDLPRFGIETEEFDERSVEYHSLIVSNARYLFVHGVLLAAANMREVATARS